MKDVVLRVDDLHVAVENGPLVVEKVSFAVAAGEALGLVGESGCGKTTVAQALLGYARPGFQIVKGSVEVAGHPMLWRPEGAVRQLRGRQVSFMPQDPGASLNPAMRIGRQIREVLRVHDHDFSGSTVAAILVRAGLPVDGAFQSRFPHQLSGGQQQRVALAVALACQPQVLVLDEPTTGLDVITQQRILAEINRLRRETSVAIVYVSHDLAVVASLATRVAVMYAGRIVEDGPTGALIHRPRHPYSAALLASAPDHVAPKRLMGIPGIAVGVWNRPPGCAFAPRCSLTTSACEKAVPVLEECDRGHRVRCIRWQRVVQPPSEPPPRMSERSSDVEVLDVRHLRAEYRSRSATVIAADNVSFGVGAGECLALVGESGSGKTTIARCVVGLHEPTSGAIMLARASLAPRARERSQEQRRSIQIVFQDPYDSLNPRRSVYDALTWPLRSLRGFNRRDARTAADELLDQVRLPARFGGRYPRELSGGERQRVAIARALAARPAVLVCDEITSALDVSVQAAVLDVLAELQQELRLALLFITHDLGVVASIGDRIVILKAGRVSEEGGVATVLSAPRDSYTHLLLSAAPSLREAQRVQLERGSAHRVSR